MSNWHRHSILIAKQRDIRDMLLRAARKNLPNRERLVAFADDCEETAELITLLETAMRTADQAVKDLLTLDAAKDAAIVVKDQTIADLKTRLADAQTREIKPDTLAAVNVAAPEPESPAPQVVQAP